ncbi:hypothetical protein EV424DRAFT_1540219 [Suillus variegatus]|nr:hypothetical protein EV424DRAFT_1540219 [Suillus variegatus]
MTPPQTPSPTESTTSHLSLNDTLYRQNILNVEDDTVIESTLLSLAHAKEIERQLNKEPAHIAAPILSEIHIIHATSSLELKLNDIENDALRLSCQHLQRRIRSLTIQLLPERNATQVGRPLSTTARAATTSLSPTDQAREASLPLPVPPPGKVYQRKTRKGTIIHGVTKVKSSKGKAREVIDVDAPCTATITIKQPNFSADNFVCRICKQLGHHHKSCPQYHCRVCQAHVPGHFSIYCPYTPKKEQFLLVYTDEGFYDALAEWEAREDQKLEEELEHAHQEYVPYPTLQPEDDILFHNTDADPIYYANQDD